jgi:hypothetical protein
MSREVAEFMVFVVEQVARRFFAGDQVRAYDTMRASGLWDFFSGTYETSHTLSVEYLMEDAQQWFDKSGVAYAGISR